VSKAFRFIDLFCGIGGMRLGFESAGGTCVFSADWDKYARCTYEANFGELPHGDVREVTADALPEFDVLVAGFPCQPFSISGVSKKQSLGRPHGFRDKTQGTLFFDVARLIEQRRPKAFLLENVKNLLSHDRGRTFQTIYETLDDELDYDVHFKVVSSRPYVPQQRERIFIVGFEKPRAFRFPAAPEPPYPTLGSILQARVDERYYLTPHLWNYLQRYAEKHRAAGNGFGFGLVGKNDHARTLSARYYKDGSEILISRGPSKTPRRLTPRECARLMGFPESFQIPVSDTQAYRQFGNSVVVPVVSRIAQALVEAMTSESPGTPRQLKLVAG
jgi:DNA (cytosine-5)-methyltransferase 1